MERVDRLTEPPVVGEFYLVPTVRSPWAGVTKDWPVMGARHDDAEHLNFPHLHYHVDIRFLSDRTIGSSFYGSAHKGASSPLCYRGDNDKFIDHPAPIFKRRKCLRGSHEYPLERAADSEAFRTMWAAYAGAICKQGKAGFICPHRHFPLGSIAAIDGVITCPLHGLRIDAETGIVLANAERP